MASLRSSLVIGILTFCIRCAYVNGQEGAPWKSWSECSQTCGTGFQTRARSCGTACTEFNGQQCPQVIDCACFGPLCECKDLVGADVCHYARNRCKKSPHYDYLKTNCRRSCGECDPAGDAAAWSAWKPWTSCSVTCGAGTRWRYRGCNKVAGCGSEYFQTEPCNDGICPSEWTDWSSWGTCMGLCGGVGSMTRSRACIRASACKGHSQMSGSCFVTCTKAWGSWGRCSRTCGNGTRTKRDCSTCKVTYDDCFERECPRQTCQIGFRRRHSVNDHTCCDEKTVGTCGVSNLQGRVIPWVVQLQHSISSFTSVFCNGMLISNSWVLTAAHCIEHANSSTTIAIFGTYLYNDNSPLVQTRRISRAVLHPNYIFPRNDIAVLQLITPVVLGDFVKPICLPWGEKVTNDIMCVAPTWGMTHRGPTLPTELKMIDLRIIDFGACKQAYDRPTSNYSAALHVCAGSIRGGRDTCPGDGGSPLMCQRCSSCEWFAVGITSVGPPQCGSPNLPSMYTRISFFESWIKNITGVEGPDQYNKCA